MFQLYSADNLTKQLYKKQDARMRTSGHKVTSVVCIHERVYVHWIAERLWHLWRQFFFQVGIERRPVRFRCRWSDRFWVLGRVKDDSRLVMFAQICKYVLNHFEMADPGQRKLLREQEKFCVNVNTPQFNDPSEHANQV